MGTDTFTVPAGVGQVTIDARGAEGGGGNFAVAGGKGAQVQIKFADARKGTIVLDVTDEEAEELGRKGRRQARRGRRPKSETG